MKAPNAIDITTAQSISVVCIDNTIGDAALEALTVMVSKAMVPEAAAASLKADPDAEGLDAVEEFCVELALGTFVSVASVIVLVVPCEAMTTTEVPI